MVMSKEKVADISVILPCYNEKENILELIGAIHRELTEYNHEIIVVDDNSQDGTFELVKNKNFIYVKSFQRKTDASLAKSIRYGLEVSKGEVLIVMDSDFNHKPEYLKILISNLNFYGCVSASRFVYGGNMPNRYRHMCSWLFNIFTRIVTRTLVTDSLFGYFAIRRADLERINYDKVFYGYGDYCIRLMYYLQKNSCSILQIPCELGKRLGGEGNTKIGRTFVQYFFEVIKLILFAKDTDDGEGG